MATETGTRYTAEFKAAAIEMHRNGEPLEDVAVALDITVPVLRTWILLAGDPPPSPKPQSAPATATAAPLAHAAPPAYVAAPPGHCIVCGRGPALEVKLRSVTGIVIAFRMRRVDGRFCRDCGTTM